VQRCGKPAITPPCLGLCYRTNVALPREPKIATSCSASGQARFTMSSLPTLFDHPIKFFMLIFHHSQILDVRVSLTSLRYQKCVVNFGRPLNCSVLLQNLNPALWRTLIHTLAVEISRQSSCDDLGRGNIGSEQKMPNVLQVFRAYFTLGLFSVQFYTKAQL